MLKSEWESKRHWMKKPRVVKATEEAIGEAAEIIRGGGLVVYPTETVYGLGCDPFNPQAVERLLRVKGREKNPLPVAAASIEKAREVAQFTPLAERLASRLLPGPLMFILKTRAAFPQGVTCGLETIGIRIPDHPVALRLAELSGGYLVSTSANKSGSPPPREAGEASAQIGGEVELILDGGPSPLGRPSTVLDLTSKKARILREGPIPLERIIEVLRS